MNATLSVTKTSRTILGQILDNYTLEQLNAVPQGHNNNLLWNVGHIVVVQQGLVYGLSGLPLLVPSDLVDIYKKGTKPEQDASLEEVNAIKTLLLTTIEQTEKDLENKVFQTYKEYPTSTGFVLQNVQDAIHFNNFHEGIHLGVIFGIRKLIK